MKIWSGIVTEQVQQSKDFYVNVFGCRVIYEGDDGWFVLLQLGESELGLMKPNLPSQAEIFRPAFQGQGIWIAIEVANVDAEYQRLVDLGVQITVALRTEPWGDRHFVVVDPNGIGVDIVQQRVA
ncbi:MAG: VOC family protein [Pseudomonadota bacterium]|nr:VOC family protein [Pseudomonadota bacterium]